MNALLNVALPIFGIILVGYLTGRRRILGDHASQVLNGFAFWVALPALMLVTMTRVPVGEVLNLPFIVAFMGGTAITYAIAVWLGGKLFPNPPVARAMLGIAAVFANVGYMGVPLFLTAFGADRALPAIIAMVLTSSLTLGLGIALIETAMVSAPGRRTKIVGIFRTLLGNPLVVAPFLGLSLRAAGFALPSPVETFCSLLGGAAAPCALFALGLFLVDKPLRANLREVAWISWVKLVLQPAITWLLAVPILGMTPFWAASVVLLSALPTAAIAFTLAQQYDSYVDRASSATLATTAISVVTIPLLLVLLGLA